MGNRWVKNNNAYKKNPLIYILFAALFIILSGCSSKTTPEANIFTTKSVDSKTPINKLENIFFECIQTRKQNILYIIGSPEQNYLVYGLKEISEIEYDNIKEKIKNCGFIEISSNSTQAEFKNPYVVVYLSYKKDKKLLDIKITKVDK